MMNRLTTVFRNRVFTDYRYVWLMLGLGLLIRLGILIAFYLHPDYVLEDAHFYTLVANEPRRLTFIPETSTIAITPLYPIFLMPFFHFIPSTLPETQFVSARVVQALFDVMTSGVVYLITRELFADRAAKVAVTIQALDIRYAFVVGGLVTETLFITAFAIFMLAYMKATSQKSLSRYAGAGALLGIASLIRPVPLMFPVALIIYAWLASDRREALKGVGIVALVSLLLMAPWSIRGWLISGAPIPGSSTAFSHLWQATRDDADEIGGQELEEAAIEDVNNASDAGAQGVAEITPLGYIWAAISNIGAAPAGWIALTGERLVRAYLQPYGTVLLAVETEQTFAGTIRAVATGNEPITTLLTYPGIWRRILMYAAHFWGLLFGTVGIVIAWRTHRQEAMPLLLWILYGTALLSVLLVEARYLFPLMFAFTIFAAYATVYLWDALKARRAQRTLLGQSS